MSDSPPSARLSSTLRRDGGNGRHEKDFELALRQSGGSNTERHEEVLLPPILS
jgi:hypothetical protein